MANFESGVASYINGYAVVEVNFPVDLKGNAEICCRHCQFLSANEKTCQLNKAPVAFPNRFVGDFCPLALVEDYNCETCKIRTRKILKDKEVK